MPRDTHTATVLSDATVLIVGGYQRNLICASVRCQGGPITILSSAELFK